MAQKCSSAFAKTSEILGTNRSSVSSSASRGKSLEKREGSLTLRRDGEPAQGVGAVVHRRAAQGRARAPQAQAPAPEAAPGRRWPLQGRGACSPQHEQLHAHRSQRGSRQGQSLLKKRIDRRAWSDLGGTNYEPAIRRRAAGNVDSSRSLSERGRQPGRERRGRRVT